MAVSDFDKVVEQVKDLNPAEQWRLRDLLIIWLASPQTPSTEAELAQEMLREGILDHVPPPVTDLTPYLNRTPVDIEGEPLLETIVKERC